MKPDSVGNTEGTKQRQVFRSGFPVRLLRKLYAALAAKVCGRVKSLTYQLGEFLPQQKLVWVGVPLWIF